MYYRNVICGLYYKHITIINDNSSVFNKWQVSLTDNTRVIIYNRNMFIIQATVYFNVSIMFFLPVLFFLNEIIYFCIIRSFLSLSLCHSVYHFIEMSIFKTIRSKALSKKLLENRPLNKCCYTKIVLLVDRSICWREDDAKLLEYERINAMKKIGLHSLDDWSMPTSIFPKVIISQLKEMVAG